MRKPKKIRKQKKMKKAKKLKYSSHFLPFFTSKELYKEAEALKEKLTILDSLKHIIGLNVSCSDIITLENLELEFPKNEEGEIVLTPEKFELYKVIPVKRAIISVNKIYISVSEAYSSILWQRACISDELRSRKATIPKIQTDYRVSIDRVGHHLRMSMNSYSEEGDKMITRALAKNHSSLKQPLYEHQKNYTINRNCFGLQCAA